MNERRIEACFQRFARRGDLSALGEVFDATAPELLRIAAHLAPGASDAEDLVQSTFVTAIEHAREFESERVLLPWLVGILARHAANARRKEGRRSAAHAPGAALEEVPDTARATADEVETRELQRTLGRIVSELPETYRDVVHALVFEGRRPREIAERLGLSNGAARVRAHRGLELLRRALPVGIATGAAVSLTPSRGLAAVRAGVMNSAQSVASVATAASAPVAASFASLPRIAIAIAALLAVIVPWIAWRHLDSAEILDTTVATLAGPSEVSASSVVDAPPVDSARESVGTSAGSSVRGRRIIGRIVDNRSSEPIVGARLFTTPSSGTTRQLRAESDGDGAVEFDAPIAELETLFVEAKGYASLAVPLTAERRERFWQVAGRNESPSEVQLFELRLERGLSLAGRVVDEHGRGVGGAEIALFTWSGYTMSTATERAIGRSAADGRIEFDGPIPVPSQNDERWLLLALHESGIGWARLGQPAASDAYDDVTLVLRPGMALDASVRDASGAPVAAARVRVVPLHDPFPYAPSSVYQSDLLPLPPLVERWFSAVTDERGVAHLANLLRAREQFPNTLSCRFVVDVERDGRCVHRSVRAFDCERAARLAIVLDAPDSLALSGVVRDERGSPLAGVTIRRVDSKTSTHTAADGSYSIPYAPGDPFDIELRAELEGYAEGSTIVARDAWDFRADGHDIVMRKPLAIAGRVVDDRGAPVPGVTVYAELVDGGAGSPTPKSEPSDAQGRFEIADAAEGEFHLMLVNGGGNFDAFAMRPGTDWRARGGDTSVEIVLERRTDAPCTLEVEVVDARDGAAVDVLHAQIGAVERDVPTPSRGPAISGGKVVFSDLAAAHYDVWLATSRGNAHAEVELAAGERARVRVEVAAPGRVSGRVDFSNVARPEHVFVNGALVSASGSVPGDSDYQTAAKFFAGVELDAGARIAISDLVPGRWRFWIWAEGLLKSETLVDVEPDREATFEIVARPASVIEFVFASPLDAGWIFVDFDRGDGEWRPSGQVWQAAFASRNPFGVTLEPGHVRWRLSVLETPNRTQPVLLCEEREGELELAVNEHRRVELEVVPISRR